jgi:uncharacterized phage protein (TIGR01671 family)
MAQREIKFRAWDGEKMRFVCRIDFGNPLFDLQLRTPTDSAPEHWKLSKIADTPIMQFTGLHDKNGKEIYESDKISNGKAIFTILWNPDLCCFDMERHEGDNKYLHEMAHIIQEKYEVIGNIYE